VIRILRFLLGSWALGLLGQLPRRLLTFSSSQQAQQQLPQGQNPQQTQQAQQQPVQQQPGQTAQATQQTQPNQTGQQMTTSGTPNENAGGPPPTPTTSTAPLNATAAGTGASQQAFRLPPAILSHINEMTFIPPPTVTVTDKEDWISQTKLKYGRALYQMEQARNNVTKIDQAIKERKEKGMLWSPEEEKAILERRSAYQKQHNEASAFVQNVRKHTAANTNAPAAKPAPNGVATQAMTAQASNQGRPQQITRPPGGQQNVAGGQAVAAAPGGGGPGAMQHSTAAVNAAIEAAKNQQMAAGRVQSGGAPLPGQTGPATHPGQGAAAPVQAQASPTTQAPPAPAATAQAHNQQQTQIKVEPGIQQQVPNLPAPLNTAIAAGINAGLSAAGTPTQASARVQTPQSATPTNNVRPLTHAAAINLAAQQRPGTIAGQAGSGSASTQGVIGSQQLGHPHAHPATQTAGQTMQTKMPIPKNLHEKATQQPTPVAPMAGAGGGRPTYSGGSGIAGGVMSQPALAKTPAYQLEGEGERVLNKKKLDELVRQVCGGTAEGQEGNVLTPEVEEVISLRSNSRCDSIQC